MEVKNTTTAVKLLQLGMSQRFNLNYRRKVLRHNWMEDIKIEKLDVEQY